MLDLQGKYMVSLAGPHGTFQNVIFHPAQATVDDVKQAEQDETSHEMTISDDAGYHTNATPQYVTNVRYQYNTLVFTSHR